MESRIYSLPHFAKSLFSVSDEEQRLFFPPVFNHINFSYFSAFFYFSESYIVLLITTLHFNECWAIVLHSCPLERKLNHGCLWGQTLLAHEGPGAAELAFSSGERKKQSIHVVLHVRHLQSRGSSGLHSPVHCFTPVLPTAESSWTKRLHAVFVWPVHSLFLTYFEERKLFCLRSPFYHKIYAFLAKIRVSHHKSVMKLVYTFWNIRGTSAVKDWSRHNIIISNTV